MLDRRGFLGTGAAAIAAAVARFGGVLLAEPAPEVKTGGIRMLPVDGKYRVWTKKVGRGPIKLLTLHGGPGCTHEYFECFEDFLPQEGVEFYYYDQLGSAYSDQPDDASLWTVDRFREEVEQVRRGLGLDNFYLLGHSWGGMLAIEYALEYPQHLKGLVISDMTASIPSYMAYAAKLRAALPKDVIAVLDRYEVKGEYDAPEYQEAMIGKVYREHLCRLDPWPDPVERTLKHLAMPVYKTMQGPNEFVITGNFKNWDRWNDLPKIRVPTLVTGARHDTMNPEDIRREGRLLPNSRVWISETGSHLAMYDDQPGYFAALIGFLKDVEAGRFSKKTA
ncbi:MAG TPA: proline iminopeptidase-family hydrolase [Thermoanaerobaculia bacterium]|nr:proline iminopeptidase-family hydrolase [Thermoanaerobaculia bacterium]